MQHFIYTFLLVVTALAYTSCVSDSSSDSGKVPATPPKVVKKETPKPPAEPPVAVQEPPTPKPAPTPKPPKVATTPPPPKAKPTPPPPPKAKPSPPPVTKTYTPPATTQTVVKKEYTPPPPPPVKSGGKIAFDKPTLDYGYIEQGDVINHKFKYTNTGSVPVNILRADASCGCTQPTYSFLAINPGEQGEIGVRFDSKGKLGKMESKVTILTDAKPEKHILYLVGTITAPKKEKDAKDKKEDAKDKKEDTAKEDDSSKDTEKETVKTEDKTEKENTEPEVNKDNPKKKLKDRLPFRGRKLPKGTPPGEQGN